MQVDDRIGRIATPRPNWRSPVSVDYEYLTSVLTSYAGLEQRESLRENPRVTITHLATMTDRGVQRHMADLAEGSAFPMIVPLRWRKAVLGADVFPGASEVTLAAAAPFWLVPGVEAVLSTGGREEAATVLGVAGNLVSFAAPLGFGFPAGASLHHAYQALPQPQQEFQARTGAVWEGSVTFEARPGQNREIATGPAFPKVAGVEAFTSPPNWRDAPRVSFSEHRDTLDPGRGQTFVSTPRPVVQESTYLFTEIGTAAAERLIGFFMRMKGQRGAFWMPDWHHRGYEIVGTTGTSVTVAGRDAARRHAVSPALSALFAAGQVHQIAEATAGADSTTFEMAAPWPQEPEGRVRFAPLSRFASDTLEVRWRTGTVAEISMDIRTVNEGA